MISADDQQYLFESFATAGETNNQYETDQRLSFTHFIITEQLHGQIAVISDEDQGTTFSIQLPIK
jgi:signal transduction histidine kinase